MAAPHQQSPAARLAASHSHDHRHHHGNGEQTQQEIDLRVEGMTCAGCAATVQRSLQALPGVKGAAVNVTEGRAHVVGDNLDANAIVEAVRASGYEAEPIIELPGPAELKSEIELRQARHEREWKRRAIIGLSVWIPLEALHWIGKAAGWHSPHGAPSWMDWVMLLGATIVIIAAGGGFYRSAWSAALRRTTNMDTLIAMGATTAYVYSLVLFIMKLFGSHIDQPMYFTEAAALLGIISLGHYLEARASARAGSAVRELLELQPETAEVIDANESPPRARSGLSPRVIPSAHVKPNDRILIRPGARVPVDGIVIEGESEIDESIVTGESLPVRKAAGDQVVAGSMNAVGRLVVRATVDGRHTTVARIADMVQRAQTSRANIQRLADYIASIFVPAVMAIALITLIGWAIAGDFPTGVIATVTVLIISCPCALGLATPMAVMVGAGAASKSGVLVKSAMAFETAGRATRVIFDKTGTLTAGNPTVTNITPEERGQTHFSVDDLLAHAAAVESPSEHPIARAIVNAARQRNITIPPVHDFRAIPGQGVRGIVNGHEVVVTRDVQTTARVEVDGRTIGAITVADGLRSDAKTAIDQLRAMGLEVFMLSGDRKAVAEEVGRSLGLKPDHIIAEATPDSKVEFVKQISRSPSHRLTGSPSHDGSLPLPLGEGRGEGASDSPSVFGRALTPNASPRGRGGSTIMIGDGINDAAALAQADLGIALASGTNITIESADVVIPSDRVMAVPQTIYIARQTLGTIKQNLFFAFFYNAIAIPVAAFGLLGTIGPLVAAAAMGVSDITVIGNAIRLKRRLSR
jgi:Cu+-exporting ATPase